MIPFYREPHFTFCFTDDRIIPRFHLSGIESGQHISVYRRHPISGEQLELICTAIVGDGGWVDLTEPIIVRAGDGFLAIPDEGRSR